MKNCSYSSGWAIVLVLLTGMMTVFLVVVPHQRVENIKGTLREHVRKPVRKTICMTASTVDLSGRSTKYISHKQLREIKSILHPGDVIFRRNESQLTNIAISGFWKHSGIYIGGLDEINDFFGRMEMTDGKKPGEYIADHYPRVFRDLRHHRNMVIEAVGEGVTINPLNHFANADYFAAIRPQLSKEELFKSILKSFDFFGTEYDFFFDFQSDDALVCSELIYKSFKPPSNDVANYFRMKIFDDKPFLSPNEIVTQVCNQNDSVSSMFSFVTFYSGDEQTGKAIEKSEADFRSTPRIK